MSDISEKAKILIVDDTLWNIKLLTHALKDDYKLSVAQSGSEALSLLETSELPDLVLLDIMMPEMDGYEVCSIIKSNPITAHIPVIFITAMTSEQDEVRGFEVGGIDYITKPFSVPLVQQRIKNHIELKHYQDNLEDLVTEKTGLYLEEKDHAEKQLEDFLLILAAAIETKDTYTGGHVERVAAYSRDIAMKIGFHGKDLSQLYLGAIVHDVGKIGIKESILNKPGKLTDSEFEHIKTHTTKGKLLLSMMSDINYATDIAHRHHERWDGNGYPSGISTTEIPLPARIVSIADVWDAITSDRPYRKAMPTEQALSIMQNEREKAFDPELLDVFLNEEDKIYLRYLHLSPTLIPAQT